MPSAFLIVSVVATTTIFLITSATNDNDAKKTKTTENPVVSTSLGLIEGSFMTSRLGKRIYAFRGIRYAQPPLGQLRFEVAAPVEPWNGIFDGSVEGPSCPRASGENQMEDCLRLNVYTTKLATNERNQVKRSVMVFFHPGGFYGYSGQSLYFGPEYLLDHEIVLVTVNYRLGALGFLSTGDAEAPGNLGLKDQVESLRWIKKNIASFGGDPSSVTISGCSSGSRSVALHMLSPMSKNLFHRAISMSGSPIRCELMKSEQLNYAKKQAKLLNCPDDDTSAKIISCLRNRTSGEMASTLTRFYEWHDNPIRLWSPVVEPDIPGLERFLTAQPVDLIREGKVHDVPFLAGVTRDEFGYLMRQLVVEARHGNDSKFRDLDENWDRIAPIIFDYERDTQRSKRISRELREYYFKGKTIDLETAQGLADAYADTLVGFPTHRMVNLYSAALKNPVYYYRFVYQGRYSRATWSDTKKPFGVSHMDDLLYLFYNSFIPLFDSNAPEHRTVELMTAIWSNFVKTGEPIPRYDEKLQNITWQPFLPSNNNYMEINLTLTMKSGLKIHRMDFLDTLFPLNPLETPINRELIETSAKSK